jgi:hypothetical protein
MEVLQLEIKGTIRYTEVLRLCGITLLHAPMSNEILEYEPVLKIPKALTFLIISAFTRRTSRHCLGT